MRLNKNWLGRMCGVVADLLGQDIESSYPGQMVGKPEDTLTDAYREQQVIHEAYVALRELEKLWCSEENRDQLAFAFTVNAPKPQPKMWTCPQCGLEQPESIKGCSRCKPSTEWVYCPGIGCNNQKRYDNRFPIHCPDCGVKSFKGEIL